MTPVALTTLAPLATTALETWNQISEARELRRLQEVKAAADQDFRVMLAKAHAVAGLQGTHGADFLHRLQQQLQAQIRELPEVRGLLAASQPGATFHVTISSANELTVEHPNGSRQPIVLSESSRQIVQQLSQVASFSQPGNVTGLVRVTLSV